MVSFPKASATEEEMWDVLEKVGLKDYVDRMPNKLDTSVSRDSSGNNNR